MNRKIKALLLNALVVPGLGQLYLGRKATGIAIIMLVNLLLLLALFAVMKGLSPVIAAQAVSGAISAREIHAALHEAAGFGKALLAGFALLFTLFAKFFPIVAISDVRELEARKAGVPLGRARVPSIAGEE